MLILFIIIINLFINLLVYFVQYKIIKKYWLPEKRLYLIFYYPVILVTKQYSSSLFTSLYFAHYWLDILLNVGFLIWCHIADIHCHFIANVSNVTISTRWSSIKIIFNSQYWLFVLSISTKYNIRTKYNQYNQHCLPGLKILVA